MNDILGKDNSGAAGLFGVIALIAVLVLIIYCLATNPPERAEREPVSICQLWGCNDGR